MEVPKELAIETQIAKIKDTMLGFEEHGVFTAALILDYGDGGQSAGLYNLAGPTNSAAVFIKGVLRAAGVDRWEKVKGRTILAIREDGYHGRVVGIRPLPTEHGTEFMFDLAMSDA